MSSAKRILAVMSEWGYWGIELVTARMEAHAHLLPRAILKRIDAV